jgi:hypothetical protein
VSRQTAAGLPAKACDVNASTWNRGPAFTGQGLVRVVLGGPAGATGARLGAAWSGQGCCRGAAGAVPACRLASCPMSWNCRPAHLVNLQLHGCWPRGDEAVQSTWCRPGR